MYSGSIICLHRWRYVELYQEDVELEKCTKNTGRYKTKTDVFVIFWVRYRCFLCKPVLGYDLISFDSQMFFSHWRYHEWKHFSTIITWHHPGSNWCRWLFAFTRMWENQPSSKQTWRWRVLCDSRGSDARNLFQR